LHLESSINVKKVTLGILDILSGGSDMGAGSLLVEDSGFFSKKSKHLLNLIRVQQFLKYNVFRGFSLKSKKA